MSIIQHYQQGMAAFVAGRFTEALPHLEAAAATTGRADALIARYYLGQTHDRRGRELFAAHSYGEAATHFAAAARLIPQGDDLAEYLVRCYVRQQRFEAAAHELERMLAQTQNPIETRIRLALAQYKAGDACRAIITLREGLAGSPGSAELHYQLGVMLASGGDISAAQAHWEATIARDPSHARAMEHLAQCCSLQGRHERALRYLERAQQIQPGCARIAWQLAVAVGIDGGNVVLARPVARHDDVAMDRLASAILSEPDFIESFLSLPASAVDEDVFCTLAATLQRALKHHPEYADLHYHCGRIYRRLGRAQDAISHAERAVDINPRYVNALILLAELYAQNERCAEGLARLEAAISAGGDYPDVHYLIGRLCQNVGKPARAKEAYERALELNANYREAREALAVLAA